MIQVRMLFRVLGPSSSIFSAASDCLKTMPHVFPDYFGNVRIDSNQKTTYLYTNFSEIVSHVPFKFNVDSYFSIQAMLQNAELSKVSR